MYLDKNTLEIVDNVLCIRHDSTMSTKPEIISVYWPTTCTDVRGFYLRDQLMPLIGQVVHDNKCNDGEAYHLMVCGQRWGFYLLDGGRTKPVKSELTPVPPPKTKCKVRWYYGEWQKYLASKGWVSA